MHALEHAVLGVFKESPDATKSTTELVQALLPHEWNAVQEQLSSLDLARVRRGKQAKARLHRKLLYHVNKLIADGLLKIYTVQGRGEKRFALSMESGDVEIRSGRKQIRIHKPTKIITPIDTNKHISVFDREHWLERVNALLLEGVCFESLGALADKLSTLAPHVNDAIGVVRAETLLDGTVAEFEAFCERVKRLPCLVSLLMSVSRLGEDARLIRFCKTIVASKVDNLSLVFNVTPKSLQERREVLTAVADYFAQHDIKINMKNSSTHIAPVVCGKAGPYSMTAEDWREYREQRSQNQGVVLCGASVAIDIAEVTPHQAARQAAEALFLASRARTLLQLKKADINIAFVADTIRWWNYSLSDALLAVQLENTMEVVQEFCVLQERIYRACGLPIRCRIVASCSFGTFPGVSSRAYKKRSIQNLFSLQEEEFSQYLLQRENVSRQFIADRVRIFRSGTIDAVAIMREMGFLLHSYALPYITYDFRGLKGNVQLTEFFRGEP